MIIANKEISTTFLKIIIRTYHGQTEIVMQPALSSDLSPIELCVMNSVDVFAIDKIYRKHYRMNNFELSATIMTNSTPDHNTSAAKTVGLVHILVCKAFPTPAVHTITSIAKTK
jgi:hypothetical protein